MKLPGDFSPEQYKEQLLRVNHAGEYGAVRIYAGQKAVLKQSKHADMLDHMAEQEQAHLAFFEQEIAKHQARPTALMPLWHVLGYALGAGTALLGEKAAMACTEAVEDAIDEHYREQIDALGDKEKKLKKKLEQFRQEECEHRDLAIEHGAQDTQLHGPLYQLINKGSKLAIFLAKRI